ncbi:MAG: YkvA family protein [Anaerolineales bacterium]
MNKGNLYEEKRTSNLLWVIERLRLAWRLFWDDRVSDWVKVVPLFSILYLIWPFDLLSDPLLGLGQLDDLAVMALALKIFISLCPSEVVSEHWNALTRAEEAAAHEGETVEGEYRILDEEQRE